MRVRVDSSLLVSLYVRDANTPVALHRMNTRPDVWVTALNRSEVAHAVHQQAFRKAITEFEAHRTLKTFEDDCARGAWEIVGFPERVWTLSVDLARRFGATLGIRTLDSLHVAAALELQPDRFWTFDERQIRLAAAVGLDTSA